MDYRDSADELAFRLELRAWLENNVPTDWRGDGSDATTRRARRAWHHALFEAGYIGMSWPIEYGGRGLNPVYDAILGDEIARFDAPPQVESVNYLGRVIWTYGTEAQKARHLPTLLDGTVAWCQGFSEPGAGSDIASLRTRAERDGDDFIVNGQKMWTSGAHAADWCLLLARTDPAAPKHKGITAFLMPMASPGVTPRPVVLHSGIPETSEVFLEDVRVPADNVLGALGQGWPVAMSTFAYERGPGDIGVPTRFGRNLERLHAYVSHAGLDDDPEIRARLADAYVRGEALRLNVVEELSNRVAGRPPGDAASISKLLWIDAEQTLLHLAMDVVGADALTDAGSGWLESYLMTRPISVYGGTQQIQLNIIAQRILKMPRPSAPRHG